MTKLRLSVIGKHCTFLSIFNPILTEIEEVNGHPFVFEALVTGGVFSRTKSVNAKRKEGEEGKKREEKRKIQSKGLTQLFTQAVTERTTVTRLAKSLHWQN